MKVRTKSLPKIILANVLSVTALVVNARWILGAKASTAAVVPPASVAGKGPQSSASGKKRNSGLSDPTLNLTRLALAESEVYAGTGRNIFASAPSITAKKDPPLPPASDHRTQTDTLPSPFPLKFFGFESALGGDKRIFLLQDGEVFIGSEGDIVDRRYKILRVAPGSVDVEDLLDTSQHTLALMPK